MAIVTTDNQHYTDIAAAIRSKNGTETQYKPSEMAAAIQAISGGEVSVPVSLKEVNFYDYEGTLLYAYTLEEAKGLSELPPAPQHEGLLFQEWNWTLEDIKALTIPMNVGATYITDDGKTRLYITIPANIMPDGPPPRNQVPLYIQQTVNNGVTIDWGDGTEPETLPGTGVVNTTHTYEQAGDYVISLDPAEGCELGFGDGSTSYCVMGGTGNNGRVYCNMLKKVYIGKNVFNIENYAFFYCYSLTSVIISDSVTTIGDNAFRNCYSLTSVIIPDSVTTIGDRAFNSCYSLTSVIIPDSVTTIGDYDFQNCYSLASVIIPDSVTTIGDRAFSYCYSLALVTISNSTTTIKSGAFSYCCSLTSVTIPNSITYLGGDAFEGCYSLALVTISNSITYLGGGAFQNCYSLTSVTIPDSVKTLYTYIFSDCYGMREYHFLSSKPPTLPTTSSFDGIPSDCIIYVPKGSAEAYKTATNWATYAQYIQEEPA